MFPLHIVHCFCILRYNLHNFPHPLSLTTTVIIFSVFCWHIILFLEGLILTSKEGWHDLHHQSKLLWQLICISASANIRLVLPCPHNWQYFWDGYLSKRSPHSTFHGRANSYFHIIYKIYQKQPVKIFPYTIKIWVKCIVRFI